MEGSNPMLLSGANTYEGTQIKDNQSKFNLNCYNRDGILQGQDYRTPFEVEPLEIYERTYTNLDTGSDDTSSDISRFELEFIDDQVTYSSGMVKPSCSLFVDTTKFSTSGGNYMRKAKELNDTYTLGSQFDEVPVIGNRLMEAMKNFGTDCEVYTGVEIAVSYSGAYGESGLTKFRLTSSIIHFFVAVYDVFKYKDNPNYKYLNIYIKYGSYESLVLLNKIELDDLEEARDQPINLAEGDDDRRFYTCYFLDRIWENKDDGFAPIELDSDNKLASPKGTTALIYSGLFQFDDTGKTNTSWMISQKVSPIAPLADVETHTYLSTEDYDIERNVNDYLDDAYQLNDFIAGNANDVPYLSYDSSVSEFIENGSSNDQIKFYRRNRLNNVASVGSYKNRDITQQYEKNSSIYGAVVYQSELGDRYPVVFYDMYSDLVVSGVTKATTPSTGEFIIQYYLTDDTYGTQLIDSTIMSSDNQFYFTLSMQDLIDKVQDGEDWRIDIWYGDSIEGENAGGYYRLMSINAKYARDLYLARYGSAPLAFANEDELYMSSIATSYYNRQYVEADDIYGITLPLRDFGIGNFKDTGSNGLYVMIMPQPLIAKPDEYTCGIYGLDENDDPIVPVALSDDTNYTTDISDLLYDPESRGADDYNTYADGITNQPIVTTPDWRVNVKHIEDYDSRLWMSTIDKPTYEDVDYEVQGIVSDMDDVETPIAGDKYVLRIDDTTADKVGLIVSIGPVVVSYTTPEPMSTLYNDETSRKYKYRYISENSIYQFTVDEIVNDSKDIYYSEQGYPEVVLETNYKGYNNPITEIYTFIEQLYVFQDSQIDIIRKNLTREVNGIVEPTYQFHKSYDKGAIEWTVKEYEKKLFFTNSDGVYYIDAGGNYNKASGDINRLFVEGYITDDSVDYAGINGEFYVIKLKKSIPFSAFSDIHLSYGEYRVLIVEYVAFNIETGTWWFGNEATRNYMWFYLTKDFTQRNQYENRFKKKQLKRISVAYDSDILKVDQVKNGNKFVGDGFWFKENTKGRPIRHTLKGVRSFTYSFLISSKFDTRIVDFALIENGK